MKKYSNNKIKEILKKPAYELPGWYSNKDFLEIYDKELKRSYRTDLPLSLITITIETVSEMKLNHPDSIYHGLLNSLILIITNLLREDDVMHLNEDNIINILLINTSLDAAQTVKKKITQKLSALYNSSNNGDFEKILSGIKFNSIPLNIEQEMIKLRPLE